MHPWNGCWLKQLVTELEYYLACTRKGVQFCHESWQNDICTFRAMNVALTLSFKLISFKHLLRDNVGHYGCLTVLNRIEISCIVCYLATG